MRFRHVSTHAFPKFFPCSTLLTFLFTFFVCTASAAAQKKPAIPISGAYTGVALGGQMSLAQFNNAVGFQQGMNIEFFNFPAVVRDPKQREFLMKFLTATISTNAVPMVTLETMDGLSSYTAADIQAIAEIFASTNTGILLRWNHEMNGPWYPWGQQPDLYKERFREFAVAMRQNAKNVAMVWAPNEGSGYPWRGGSLIGGNDPYAGYYPGDDVVDWVGMSFYHWGFNVDTQTLGYNILPDPNEWSGSLRGYRLGLPDFYGIYAEQKGKPMIVPETSALFRISGGGPSEIAIKKEWIKQAYNLGQLPYIKAVGWFNTSKYEQELNDEVSWRIDTNETLANLYADALSDPRWVKGSDYALFGKSPSDSYIRGVTYPILLQYAASAARTVNLSLYKVTNGTWEWITGAQAQVIKGSGTVSLSLKAPTNTSTGTNYILEIATLPENGQWYERLHYDQKNVVVR